MTHRGVCPRCGGHFGSPVKFSQHFDVCSENIQPSILMDIFGVSSGESEQCWLMDHPSSREGARPPKIGIGRKDTVRVHVAMAIAVHGDLRDDGLMVCHVCDNVRCLNPSHMYWGTARTNVKDSWRNGRRTMTQEQLDAMVAGLRSSKKNKQAIARRNRETAAQRRGDRHWTRRSDEDMTKWKTAIREGRERSRKEGDAND